MSLVNEKVERKELNRKKYCRFKKMGIKYVDYKDPNFLLKFLNEQSCIPLLKSEKCGARNLGYLSADIYFIFVKLPQCFHVHLIRRIAIYAKGAILNYLAEFAIPIFRLFIIPNFVEPTQVAVSVC